jgi:hypothetical protein
MAGCNFAFVFDLLLHYHSVMKRKVAKRKKAVATMKGKVTGTFAQQVAGFVRRYRPALEALAKR